VNYDRRDVVITGATSGIGAAFAAWFARAGAQLILTGRRFELLEAARGELTALGAARIELIVGDLADEAVAGELERAVATRPIAVLVNNAGFGYYRTVADASSAQLAAMLFVHVELPLRLCKAALERMTEARDGLIINVGSLAGRVAVPGSALYVATKCCLERLSESLALEASPYGVVVQALTPGYVRTDFHRDVDGLTDLRRNRGLIRWMDPEAVVDQSLRAAERARRRLAGHRGRSPRTRDVVVIPGRANRFLAAIEPFIPRSLVYRAAVSRAQL
jgi:uncharacterized protein